MKAKSNIKKLFFYLCNVLCLGLLCCVPICYPGGGAPLTSPHTNLSTTAEETIEVVPYNKLGQDLAEAAFGEVNAALSQKAEAYYQMMQNRGYLTEGGEFNPESLFVAHQEILSWIVDDKVVALNDEEAISGDGSQTNPYVIKNAKGWKWFVLKTGYPTEEKVYTYAELGADIDFGGELYYLDAIFIDSDGNMTGGLTGFSGILDGKGHSISNAVFCGSGLFTNIGNISMVFSSGDMNTYNFEPSQIKNLDISKGIYTIFLGGDSPCGVIAGLSSDVVFENVNFGLQSYGQEQSDFILYAFEGTKFLNCNFNLIGYESMVCAFSAVSVNLFELESNGEPIVIDNCTSTIEVIGGGANFVGIAMQTNLQISNSTTYGYIFANSGDGFAGSFVAGRSGDMSGGAIYQLINCTNYTTMATTKVSLGGIISTSSGDTSLNVTNCKNYGDLYCIGVLTLSSLSSSVPALSGIVGLASENTNINVTNCDNYGDLYSGMAQVGILATGSNTSAVVTHCNNYGNFMYAGGSQVGMAFSAGIFSGNQAIIQNCTNNGNFINYSFEECKKLGYIYEVSSYGTIYHHAGWTFSCGIAMASMFAEDSSGTGNIAVSNCHNNAYYRHIGNAIGICWASTVNVRIENCSSYINAYGGNKISSDRHPIETEGNNNGGVIYGLCMGKVGEIRNCYSEIYAQSEPEEDEPSPAFILPAQFDAQPETIVENVQGYCEVDLRTRPYDYDNWAKIQENHQYYSFWMGVGLIDDYYGPECPPWIAKELPNMRNVYLKVKTILSEGYPIDDPYNPLTTWGSDNVVIDIDITSGDNNRKMKWLIDKDETTFDDSWFYSPELNNGIPMLRQFFWQEKFVDGQDDILSQFEKMGFTKYEAA